MDELVAVCSEIVKGKEQTIASLPVNELQQLEYLGNTYHALYDLDDFIGRLATEPQYTNFKKVLDEVVIYKQTTPMATYAKGSIYINRYSGLSIYVPQAGLEQLNEWYKGMDWYKVTYQ